MGANGILNVSSVEKSSGKENKITITNDKGRLDKDEIERLVEEAEKFKAEDEQNRVRIEAKNGLENYAYNLKNTMCDETLKDKIDDADKKTIEEKADDILKWLDANQTAEKEEYEEKHKELQGMAHPIMQNVYASGGGA